MNRYTQPTMKQLADQQVRYAPLDRKLQQLERAESLLAEIEPSKEYPYQYICYRITEYRSDAHPDLTMNGEDVQHDLRMFIEDVSAAADLLPNAVEEPVLTVDEVSKKFNISTKTVNRWRDRGLVGWRFNVDGRKRIGFLQSSLERFVSNHHREVDRSARFSQLSEEEKEQIVYRARRMAKVPTATLADVSRRIAKKLGRSPETVRYTIKNYDREHPNRPIFPKLRGPLDSQTKQSIFKSYRRGIGIEALAEKYHRTRSSVYRIINEMRADRLLSQPIDYMYDPSFDKPDAESIILGPEPQGKSASSVKAPAGLPPYLQSLYQVPLLTREQEQYLFRKMNYLLHRAKQVHDQIDNHKIKASQLDEIERFQEEALQIKRRIVRSNLRLVVSIAKRHLNSNIGLFELISDGNVSLMRAAEKFDYSRGNKFSTYASWAIMKNFARTIPAEATQRDRFVTGHELAFELTPDQRTDEFEVVSEQKQMQQALERILGKLDDRERKIIICRYGLSDKNGPQTLEEVGNKFGVTKERIRQIEARAISKLRELASEDKLDKQFLN